MNKKTLKNYAKVIVKVGANISKDQFVNLFVSTDNTEIAEYVVEEAYKCGAKHVQVRWMNDKIAKLQLLNDSIETLSTFTSEQKGRLEDEVKSFPVNIYIEDSDPDAFNGVPVEKMVEPRKAKYKFIKKYNDKLDGQAQWTIVAMPSISWAKKMYPGLPADKAVKKLEKAIMHSICLDEKDPFASYDKHIKYLEAQAKKMNKYNFKTLHYTSSNGTDFTVDLHPDHQWCTAWEKQKNGISSCVNMPTEEVFTHPDINSANGIVYASKPLSYNGNLIEDFSVTFENGKAVKVKARKGQKQLEEMIKMDPGSSRLGEVALVPYDSKINQIGTLFYNTLFDENAACHLALGDGIAEAIKGHEKMNKKQLKAKGVNDSMIHVDFMIGAKDTKIVGIKQNGKEVVVFDSGVWAI